MSASAPTPAYLCAGPVSAGNPLPVIDGAVLRIELFCVGCSEAYEVPVTSTNELPAVFCHCGEPCSR